MADGIDELKTSFAQLASNFQQLSQIFDREVLNIKLEKEVLEEEKDKIFRQMVEEKEALLKQLQEERLKLEAEKKEIEEFKSKLHILSTSEETLKLNVGGTVFETTPQTMARETSLLSAMFSAFRPESKDNSYFIDRNPIFFPYILEWLRSGTLTLEEWKEDKLAQFREEVVFYQLEKLLHFVDNYKSILEEEKRRKEAAELRFLPEFCGKEVTLSANNKKAKFMGTGWKGAVLASPSRKFSVKLNRRCKNLMIGLAPKTIDLNAANHTKQGYFFYTNTGSLWASGNEKVYSDPVTEDGTIITVVWENESVHFWANGKDLGLAFEKVVGDLNPAFNFALNNSEIELVNED